MKDIHPELSATLDGFDAVSMQELDRVEGGLGFLAALGAVAVGFCIGYTVTSLIKKAVD